MHEFYNSNFGQRLSVMVFSLYHFSDKETMLEYIFYLVVIRRGQNTWLNNRRHIFCNVTHELKNGNHKVRFIIYKHVHAAKLRFNVWDGYTPSLVRTITMFCIRTIWRIFGKLPRPICEGWQRHGAIRWICQVLAFRWSDINNIALHSHGEL